MAVQEARTPRDAEGAPPDARGSWLARVNEFGERHAKAIITVSTGLIILTVLIFAKHFYDRAQVERAESELAEAQTVEKLKELKQIYGGTPVGPKIVYRLANRYYEQNELENARAEYKAFEANYPTHPFLSHVRAALDSLEKNQKFLQGEREGRLKSRLLQTHPRQLAEVKDPRFQWGPAPSEKPVVEIETGAGSFRVKLFAADAPKTVEHFLKLVDEKGLDGLKWTTVHENERVQLLPKEGAAPAALPLETSGWPADAFSLVMVKKEGAAENLAGQFQILLKAMPDLKDVTVFGVVDEGSSIVSSIKKDDTVKSAVAVRKTPPPTPPIEKK